MNKAQLIDKVATGANVSKIAAGQALDAIIDSIIEALQRGDDVALIGFGTFTLRERSSRAGRNPQTGKEIIIPAAKIPGFRAGKGLKSAVK